MAAIRWARTVRNLDASDKLVLLLLADHADDAGLCWPSVAGLAEDGCMGERTVQRALNSLVAAGLVAREGNGGRGLTRRYTLSLDASGKVSPDAERVTNRHPIATPERVPSAPKRVTNTAERVPPTTERVSDWHPNPQEPSFKKEEKKERGRAVALAPVLPSWLPVDAWSDWTEHRKQIRKPMTEMAAKLSIKELSKFRDAGQSPRAVIEQSIANGWTGLFALKNQPAAKPYRNGFIAVAERYASEDPEQGDPEPNPFLTYEARPHVH